MSEDFPEDVLEQLNNLQTVNGVRVDDDATMEIQVAFDGQSVTFRGESGELETMGLLCYLDFILNNFILSMTDQQTGEDIHPAGITPGHVLCHVVRHLHEQYHELLSNHSLSLLAKMLAGGMDDIEGGIFKLDEDGLTEIDLSQMEAELGVKSEAESSDGDDDGDEIVIHGIHNDPKRSH